MQTADAPTAPTRSTWGTSRFGGGRFTLIVVSVVSGLLIAALISLTMGSLMDVADLGLFLTVGTALSAPVTVVTIWAILVDRSTVRGAVSRPERTIENDWSEKAAHRCSLTMGIILGPAILLFLIAEGRQWWTAPPTSSVLVAVLLLMWGTWALHYQLIKRAES